MKAVIPAAGTGSRLAPLTIAQPKEMLPILDKPVIQYVVEEAVDAGITDILIVTGRGKYAIENHFAGIDINTNIYYTRQHAPAGLADAVRCSRGFVHDEPFVVLLGDTITVPPCTRELIKAFDACKGTIIAVERVKDVTKYGIVSGIQIGQDVIRVTSMVEKPRFSTSNLGILGRYVLTPAIFEAIEQIDRGVNDEYQLTDALAKLRSCYAYLYHGRRYDIGDKLGWLVANAELGLADLRYRDGLMEVGKWRL